MNNILNLISKTLWFKFQFKSQYFVNDKYNIIKMKNILMNRSIVIEQLSHRKYQNAKTSKISALKMHDTRQITFYRQFI